LQFSVLNAVVMRSISFAAGGRGAFSPPARDGGAEFRRDDLRPIGLYAEMRSKIESEIEAMPCHRFRQWVVRRGVDIDRNGISARRPSPRTLLRGQELVAILLLVQIRGRENDAGLLIYRVRLPGLRGPDIPIAHKIGFATAAKKGPADRIRPTCVLGGPAFWPTKVCHP